MSTLALSVIICTKDREESLRECLGSLLRQSRLPDEVVIVDDGNLDGEVLGSLVRSRGVSYQYLRKQTPGLTASRNLGVEHARGDIVLFLDDDVVLDRGYAAGIMEGFEQDPNGRIGGATGALRIHYRRGVLPFLRFFGLDGRQPGTILRGNHIHDARGGPGGIQVSGWGSQGHKAGLLVLRGAEVPAVIPQRPGTPRRAPRTGRGGRGAPSGRRPR